jgi:hypothetical protein
MVKELLSIEGIQEERMGEILNQGDLKGGDL